MARDYNVDKKPKMLGSFPKYTGNLNASSTKSQGVTGAAAMGPSPQAKKPNPTFFKKKHPGATYR
jgi:hypothetical protein